jgi:hypothetical protein
LEAFASEAGRHPVFHHSRAALQLSGGRLTARWSPLR